MGALGEAANARRQGRRDDIQFGFSTTCMPMALGYERLEVAVWNTLGRCNDYLSVVDQKPGTNQAEPRWFK